MVIQFVDLPIDSMGGSFAKCQRLPEGNDGEYWLTMGLFWDNPNS